MGIIASKYNIDLLSNGTIRHSEKFADSKSNITDEMKMTLDSLCPKLKEIITQKRNLIKSITFEGHTSKKWQKDSKITPYYGNKALSYERATKTMQYCLGESFEYDNPEFMKKFHAFGYSYSNPIRRTDNSIDWNA
jgi:flagellar motor protein MotB